MTTTTKTKETMAHDAVLTWCHKPEGGPAVPAKGVPCMRGSTTDPSRACLVLDMARSEPDPNKKDIDGYRPVEYAAGPTWVDCAAKLGIEL